MRLKKPHINMDAGEGITGEYELYPFVNALNVACGGHYGDKRTIFETLNHAIPYEIELGAHPSYPDKENFGRVSLELSSEELAASIVDQIDCFARVVEDLGTTWTHIKPHGALYNDLAKNASLAEVFLNAIASYKEKTLYLQESSIIALKAEEHGFKVAHEYFIDRNYLAIDRLVPRSEENALISDPKQALDHLHSMADKKSLRLLDGFEVSIEPHTFCIHSDHQATPQIVAEITKAYGV
jgi:UPF0271 protein